MSRYTQTMDKAQKILQSLLVDLMVSETEATEKQYPRAIVKLLITHGAQVDVASLTCHRKTCISRYLGHHPVVAVRQRLKNPQTFHEQETTIYAINRPWKYTIF